MTKWYVYLTYRNEMAPDLFEFATEAKAREFIQTMPEHLRPNIKEAELYSDTAGGEPFSRQPA